MLAIWGILELLYALIKASQKEFRLTTKPRILAKTIESSIFLLKKKLRRYDHQRKSRGSACDYKSSRRFVTEIYGIFIYR